MFRYKCVIVLCDSQWCDPDLDSTNGIQMGLRDMLRVDAMLMMVQLNIRMLLEVGRNAVHPVLLNLYVLVASSFGVVSRAQATFEQGCAYVNRLGFDRLLCCIQNGTMVVDLLLHRHVAASKTVVCMCKKTLKKVCATCIPLRPLQVVAKWYAFWQLKTCRSCCTAAASKQALADVNRCIMLRGDANRTRLLYPTSKFMHCHAQCCFQLLDNAAPHFIHDLTEETDSSHILLLSNHPWSLHLLQAAKATDVNIITEKVAFDGVTRFEDRYRLPLGVTVNLTDYSAQLATEVHRPTQQWSFYLLDQQAWVAELFLQDHLHM